jgi:uncharacterized membrane protein YhaH (DUF805 family)
MDLFTSFFTFRGRIGRGRYWLVGLLQLVLSIPLVVGTVAVGNAVGAGLGILGGLVLAWMGFAATVRRWHDRDTSGWWVLIAAVPLIGPLWVLIELGFLGGTPGDNRFGPPSGPGSAPSGGWDPWSPSNAELDGIVARWKANEAPSHQPAAAWRRAAPAHDPSPPRGAAPAGFGRRGAASGFGRRGLA